MTRIQGFNMLDVIIAIAIISILATIAVPSYQSFRINSMDSSGKSQMSALFQFEKLYFNEFNSYSTRLDQIGFEVDGRLFFNIGFSQDFNYVPPGAPTGSAGCTSTCLNTSTCAANPCFTKSAWVCDATASDAFDANISNTATRTTFLAQAHGHLGNGACNQDTMTHTHTITIDHTGQILINKNAK